VREKSRCGCEAVRAVEAADASRCGRKGRYCARLTNQSNSRGMPAERLRLGQPNGWADKPIGIQPSSADIGSTEQPHCWLVVIIFVYSLCIRVHTKKLYFFEMDNLLPPFEMVAGSPTTLQFTITILNAGSIATTVSVRIRSYHRMRRRYRCFAIFLPSYIFLKIIKNKYIKKSHKYDMYVSFSSP
jgi:hypothetical protein